MDHLVEGIDADSQQSSAGSGSPLGGEGVGGAPGPLKRQRDPLSDSGILLTPEGDLDKVKRRRLGPAREESIGPCQPSAESTPKQHTSAISSVKPRAKQLTEKETGGAAVFSGAGVSSLTPKSSSGSEGEENGTVFHLLGDAEFRSRVERFELGPSRGSPSLSTPLPSVPSGLARAMQQKLHAATTPSTGRAQRFRQEREQELQHMRIQPITNNSWLKRSLSDESLAGVESSTHTGDGANGVSGNVQPEESAVPAAPVIAVTPAITKEPSPTRGHAGETGHQDAEQSPPEELSTSKIIDQLFAGVLDTSEEEEGESRNEEEETAGERDEPEERRGGGDGRRGEGGAERDEPQEEVQEAGGSTEEELLSPLLEGPLSPLSKAVEAAVTALRLPFSHQNGAQPTLTPNKTSCPPEMTAPLYSINAYHTQRQKSQKPAQHVTPVGPGLSPEKLRLQPQPSVSAQERIALLKEEAKRLQGIIGQALKARSCCADPSPTRRSLEIAEAEIDKLLLVSCEKRSALLAEISRLRAEGMTTGPAPPEKPALVPCRGTVAVGNIRLPLKADFVTSVQSHAGQPTHYFFVLIRHGAENIVDTPLATAADALNGNTISFPTSVTLRDIPSSFEIDVEVFSLCHRPGNNLSSTRSSTKSKVTPKKFLNTITRTNHSVTSSTLPAGSPQTSSNFTLVGFHRITLQSLGQSKFPLDKVKFEGKVRRLLGDEFQEKVPFLSPLEGNLYLQLNYEGHSHVQHSGFLSIFEEVSSFWVWRRHWFCLDGSKLSYWSNPSKEHSETPEGSISLLGSSDLCVRPLDRSSCARPHAFELSSAVQPDNDLTPGSRRLAAASREEMLLWVERLGQALLDLHTWGSRPRIPSARTFNGRPLQESTL